MMMIDESSLRFASHRVARREKTRGKLTVNRAPGINKKKGTTKKRKITVKIYYACTSAIPNYWLTGNVNRGELALIRYFY